ncbi:CLAVATA 3/ESR protein [Perilla frutescens var. hirtella]|uniref:CLAVATA 3/ESR protein n=1 Tax=Perilla frutescens var. hirtella TaxID=608512 RepID=A0AAD4IUZ2_PERFH|nr:CLAVATA 3/ESR protein [Perilla frutescens var. hirtella]
MRTLQIFFLCLILLALQHHYATSSTFQEPTTGSFKISTAAYNSGNTGGNSQKVTMNRKEAYEQKVHKTPSGPSPVGNNRPPSKT